MKNKIQRWLIPTWNWLTAALVTVCGVCMMIGCVTIYRSGDRPFSPESISAQFGKFAWLIWLTAGVVAVGIVIHLLFPGEKSRIKAIRAEQEILAALKTKAGTVTDEALAAQLAQIQKRSHCVRFFFGFTCGFCVARLILFFFDPAGFTIENLNKDILRFAANLAVYGTMILVCLIGSAFAGKIGCKKQIALYKAAIRDGKCDGSSPAKAEKTGLRKAIPAIRIAVAAIAILFIVLGVMNEGIVDVLGKAIAICTECIGLG